MDAIGAAKYVNLTTYRKNGTPVATPVWQVTSGGELFIVSDASAWKVKRIRNNSQVEVTVSDFRGRVTPGAATAKGEARLLDEAGTAQARALLARKYLMSRLGNAAARLLRLRRPPLAGIAITFPTA